MKKGIFTVLITIFSMSLFAQTDINTPVLIEPNDVINQMPDVTLNWYPVSGVGNVTYNIQLSEDPSFSTFEPFSSDLSSIDMTDIGFGTEFFWRVQASDDNGDGDWSEPFSFETFHQLELNTPSNEATDRNPNALLGWKETIGTGGAIVNISGVDFEFQISLDSLFTEIVDEGSTDSLFSVNAAYLDFDETYYWHVKAFHSMDESDWSEVWSFSTLASVTLTSPADGATEQMLDLELKWNEVTGIFDYMYEISLTPDFTMPISGTSDTNVVSPVGLYFGNTYYWRVTAPHATDTTVWSEVRSFETINTVYLLSPEDGANTDRTPTFTWEIISGASGYELQYDTSDEFTNPVIFEEIDTSYIVVVLPEEIGITYFWRVRAIENWDTTNWSEERNLVVDPNGINDIFSLNSINIYPNPSTGYINIDLDAIQQSEVEVRIIDLVGKTIYNNTLHFGQGFSSRTIDLKEFNDGIYLLEVKIDQEKHTDKIIINK